MKRKLKIGFVLHGGFVPAWYAATLNGFIKQGTHDLCFLHFPPLREQTVSFAYRCFVKFEERWFKSMHNAQQLIPVTDITKDCLSIDLSMAQDYCLKPEEQNKVRELGLDLVYTIAFDSTHPENLSETASFGLWYIRFGYGTYNNGSLPAFWEVMDNSPVIGSYLLMRKNNSDSILLESTTATIPHSVKNSFNSVAWKSSSFLSHRITTLAVLYDTFQNRFKNKYLRAAKEKKVPGSIKMVALFTRNVFRYVRYKYRMKTDKGKFTLLYSVEPFRFESFQDTKFNAIDLPADSFFADPFVVTKDKKHYIFFEEFVYSRGKAHISLLEVDAAGKASTPQIVLDKPYHLSYPFVFEKEGEYYMIPDNSANKLVSLYKATNFPLQWKFVMNLIEGQELIDSTLVFKNGLWWLFANSFNHSFVSTNDQLFLYYSDHLFSSEWKPHPLNPIVNHIDNCRPAGRLFKKGDKLYRPAQNNASQQYGYGMVLNEIVLLNENEYVEKPVCRIDPLELGLKATHNLDFTPDLLVIDGILK